MRSHNQTNWTRPDLLVASAPQVSAFEQIVRELKLKPVEYQKSNELREWVRKNKDQRYVPPDLLRAWGLTVHEV